MALSFRSRLEHASAPWVERLHSVPRSTALVVLVIALAVGILAPAPWAGVALLLVALFIGWMLFLTWPRLTLPERLMRVAVLALTLAVAIVRLVPNG